MDRRLLPLATAILVAACQAGTPGSQPPGASLVPTPTPTPTPPPSLATTPSPVALASGPEMSVTLVGIRADRHAE